MVNFFTIFILTIFEIMTGAIIFGFGFYVLNIELKFGDYIATFMFAILLFLALFAINLVKNFLTSN